VQLNRRNAPDASHGQYPGVASRENMLDQFEGGPVVVHRACGALVAAINPSFALAAAITLLTSGTNSALDDRPRGHA
jgi:hypothetical protein